MSNIPTPAEKGRAIMSALIAAVITSEVFSLAIDQGKITAAVCIRVGIEAVLLSVAWRGFAWARWAFIAFGILGAGAAIAYIVEQANPALIALAVYYSAMTLILIFSSSVAAFQRSQREEPIQPPQRNAGSRPSSDDSSVSETPSSLGPRG